MSTVQATPVAEHSVAEHQCPSLDLIPAVYLGLVTDRCQLIVTSQDLGILPAISIPSLNILKDGEDGALAQPLQHRRLNREPLTEHPES